MKCKQSLNVNLALHTEVDPRLLIVVELQQRPAVHAFEHQLLRVWPKCVANVRHCGCDLRLAPRLGGAARRRRVFNNCFDSSR